LVPVGIEAVHGRIQSSGPGHIFSPVRWDRANDEIIVARSPVSNSDFNCNIDVTYFVSFDEGEFIRGKQAVAFLNALPGEVERVVLAIEAETRRLYPSSFA
jgi:hypothetical protein